MEAVSHAPKFNQPIGEWTTAKALPPWWILKGVRPEGPPVDKGGYTSISFTADQQEKYGISADGAVVDKTKHEAAFVEVTSAPEITDAPPSEIGEGTIEDAPEITDAPPSEIIEGKSEVPPEPDSSEHDSKPPPLLLESRAFQESQTYARAQLKNAPCTKAYSGPAKAGEPVLFFIYPMPEDIVGTNLLEKVYPGNILNRAFDSGLQQLLGSSASRTEDPSKATFFLIPVELSTMAELKMDASKTVCRGCKAFEEKVISWMQKYGPYWQRNAGADHLVTSQNCPKTLNKNPPHFPRLWGPDGASCGPIQLCLRAKGVGRHDFYRSVHVPYHVGEEDWALGTNSDLSSRPISVYFAGSLLENMKGFKVPPRKPIVDAVRLIPGSVTHVFTRDGWNKNKDFRNQIMKEVSLNMSRAVFTLVPKGDTTPESRRIFQALACGSVPIVLTGAFVPNFAEILDWSKFSVLFDLDSVLFKDPDPSLRQQKIDQWIGAFSKVTADQKKALLEGVQQWRDVFRFGSRGSPGGLEKLIVSSLEYRRYQLLHLSNPGHSTSVVLPHTSTAPQESPEPVPKPATTAPPAQPAPAPPSKPTGVSPGKKIGSLPIPTGPSPWPIAEIQDEAYVFYWYEIPEKEMRTVYGQSEYREKAKKSWVELVESANSYSPIMCMYVAIWSLRKVRVKPKILFLSTNPEAKEDPILRWLGVEVRVVKLQTAICKTLPGIPDRRIGNLGQFTKLAVFDQTDLKAALYLDADAVFVRSLDDEIALFRRSEHLMGVVPYPQNHHCGDDHLWDYGKHFARIPRSRTCMQDEFNCGMMFMRPSAEEFSKAKEMTEDKANFWDSSCGATKNKCYLGEADFMHQIVRKRSEGGKAFCVRSELECLGDKMHLCDGRYVKMVHWAGRRKPWREWWDAEEKRPRSSIHNCGPAGKCTPPARESVRLWWAMHDELLAVLAGKIDPLEPPQKLDPRGQGSNLRFYGG
jgi:hypothetical protein